ncbi:MAG: sigma-54-dependent Fis family transcriptional regulator [Deltaproteobacteria bacterium]|nr:sigma-54-dependent Fis family transcriptional regulator [Deltaproteobacteria bacterium]
MEQHIPKKILIVDDDENMLQVLKFRIEEEGYEPVAVTNAKDALELSSKDVFDLALVDLRLVGTTGIDLMKELHSNVPEMPVIILTAYGTIETAVQAMQQGAYSYLTKPFDYRDLIFQIRKGLEKNQLAREVKRLRALVGESYGFSNIIGKSKAMRIVMEQVARAAETDSNVCIYGESGTGKELIAKSLHLLSSRKDNDFVAINCGAIPEKLFEAELFGYKKGAFTGAIKDKKGYFSQADKGSLFLDEIAELPESVQVKLLRVLQEHTFYPLGSERLVTVDVRIIAATNADLEDKVRNGAFREDLYYRVHIIPIYIPPLRNRKDDIPLLSDYFIKKYAKRMKKEPKELSSLALQKLLSYSWPGNVRELENTIEYAMAMSEGHIINEDLVLHNRRTHITDRGKIRPLKEARAEFEKEYIRTVLSITKGNVTEAAKLTGKYRSDFYGLLKKYDLQASDFKNANNIPNSS